jgi:UDP-N-acetylglucosamine 2-epimerase (non-hydrolysing)
MGGRILCVIGTRPEAIKLAPVIVRLRERRSAFEAVVLTTGQQSEMAERALDGFGIVPDVRLAHETAEHRLDQKAARLLVGVTDSIEAIRPDFVLAQGDTTTVLATSLACFYQRVHFGHVEAGLRTGLRDSPFPEEMHRVLAGRLASLHFAPTEGARSNLLAEGVDPATIFVTGNTVIDALGLTFERAPANPLTIVPANYLLVTFHRRENWAGGLEALCGAMETVLERIPELEVVLPVHPNPNVRLPITERLGGRPRIHLIEPVDYPGFVALMRDARLILTDSGGIQEEAPALGKTVLVAREETERPEGLATGLVHVVPLNAERLASSVVAHWKVRADPVASLRPTPYGDGNAAERIVRAIENWTDSSADRPRT